MTRRQLTLNLFIYPGGHHEAAWRYKDSAPHRLFDICLLYTSDAADE